MVGGHASVNGCVVGAVLGLATGYPALPSHWIHRQIHYHLRTRLRPIFFWGGDGEKEGRGVDTVHACFEVVNPTTSHLKTITAYICE